ncbi:hypothetical protein [Lentilactobacillus sp. SPB1-3]|uniref:Uncharacterized protein n=1 Tax=Lentilactobacillus terminaliae TaxID=3003483 RepID=A0ACD5DCM0_9LACO|nr:hypothetical protein [Lentilactobacillus sp. SPB1-3]MCZ0978075.1 hypothetical protein [Lentilactobacillus sp. SPB1-3]
MKIKFVEELMPKGLESLVFPDVVLINQDLDVDYKNEIRKRSIKELELA